MIFEDGFIKLEGETIRAKDIQTVSVVSEHKGGGCALNLFGLIGLVTLALGFTHPVFFLLGIAFIATGFWAASRVSKEIFELRIVAGGQTKVLTESTDRTTVEEFKAEIESAMAQTN